VKKVLPKGSKPSIENIKEGLTQLKKDIAKEKPVLILAVGKTAASAILGWDINMSTHSGTTLFSEILNTWVVPVIHPSAVARNTHLKSDFIDGIWVAKEVIKAINKSKINI
jgi:uracil-DNA glycosylase family 4